MKIIFHSDVFNLLIHLNGQPAMRCFLIPAFLLLWLAEAEKRWLNSGP